MKIVTALRETAMRLRLLHKKANRLPGYDRGWLAGIIDGEGCLMLKRYGNTFRTCVTVTNTNKKIVQHALGMTGLGHIYPHEPLELNHKIAYIWELETTQVKEVLGQIILVAKEEQRKLLLEAQDLIEQHTAGYTPYIPRLEEIQARIHVLNKKGRDVPSK